MTTNEVADIKPGDIYEDCAFHPVLCLFLDDDAVRGVSLIDATSPRSCSLTHCGVVKLSIEDVIAARTDWAKYLARRQQEFANAGGQAAPAP